jgi:arylsulfatase A-like enzyme
MNRGFDECYKFMGRGGHSYFDLRSDSEGKFAHPIYRNKQRINDEGYLTNRLTDEAVEFIERNKTRPFFLYLAYNAVHAPAQAPQADVQSTVNANPGITPERAILMAMLKHLDDGIGQVVGKLKQEKLFNNTLLFFLTDNGGSKAMSADNTPLRGFKGSFDEGGIRTPFIVSWPAMFPGGRIQNTPVMSLDILPTAVDAVGALPDNHQFDGKSLLPLLTGKSEQHHSKIYWSKGGEGDWAIRQGDWKIHVVKGKPELIHLANDPSEKNDLSGKQPMRVKQMTNDYRKWIQQMKDPITGGSRFWKSDATDNSTKEQRKSEAREIQREKKRAERKAKANLEKKK